MFPIMLISWFAWPGSSANIPPTTDCAGGVHMLGFRGHFASKSRRYSTTLGALRSERRAYRQRQSAEQAPEVVDEDTTLVVSHWEFAGVGYLTTGDTTLALSAAARAREQRQTARDAYRERMHTVSGRD
jgi:hypothetical protein